MDISKTFYVETSAGKTKIYNVNKRFFIGKFKSGGLIESFDIGENTAKNAYVAQLKKDGWLPLSLEDIGKTSVNEIGIVTAYPFKHRKGYMTIESIEVLTKEKGIKWECIDHLTNPFSAMQDYMKFVYDLKGDETRTESMKRQIAAFSNRLQDIGAIETIENFFTEVGLLPDPRRFNKTAKELWRYYKHHINDCCRLVLHSHIKLPDCQFSISDIMINLVEISPLQSLISDTAYEQWLERTKKNS